MVSLGDLELWGGAKQQLPMDRGCRWQVFVELLEEDRGKALRREILKAQFGTGSVAICGDPWGSVEVCGSVGMCGVSV